MRNPGLFFASLILVLTLAVPSGSEWGMRHPAGASKAPQNLDNRPYIVRGSFLQFQSLLKNPQNFVGLELIEASAGEELETKFGHSLLRIVDNDSDPLNDVTFNFYPILVDESGRSVGGLQLKTFVSHFQLGVEINNFQSFVLKYAKELGRELYRIPVLSTPRMRQELLRELELLLSDAKERGHYTATNNNCLGVLFRALEKAGFPKAGQHTFLPADTEDYFRRVGLSPFRAMTVHTQAEQLLKSELTVEKLLEEHSRGQAEKLIMSASLEDLWRLIFFSKRSDFPFELRHLMTDRLYEQEENFFVRDDVRGVSPMAASLYNLCENRSCVENLLPALKAYKAEYFPEMRMEKFHRQMRGTFYDEKPISRARQRERNRQAQLAVARTQTHWQGLRPILIQHYQQIAEELGL